MSTLPTAAAPATELYQAWQALRLEQPRLRAREAAARLGVSEAELTASRLGVDSWRLRPDWAELLRAFGTLGHVMVLTRNEHCVHERKGLYREVSVSASGQMGLVVSADIDLRLFLGGWASVFAVAEEIVNGTQRSIQVFDQQGVAVHKVYLTEHSELAAWQPLLERFAGEQRRELQMQPAPAAPQRKADADIDSQALREGWAALQDTHHFFALLKKHEVARTQALRLAGECWAQPLAPLALTVLMEQAAACEVPLMVFVGNRHCIQIHTGSVHNLRWMDTWFNVLDPEFNLHLQTAGVVELWRVRKPSVDGVITSLEAFDADGELVIQLFGARKPGMAERDDWRELAESLPVLA